jgi:hypothetical protein
MNILTALASLEEVQCDGRRILASDEVERLSGLPSISQYAAQ